VGRMPPTARYYWELGCRCILLSVIAFGFFGSGCSSDRAAMREAEIRINTPLPPAFLTGPAALVLTNGGGWRAHVGFRSAAAPEGSEGELAALGSKLRYTPEYPGAARKAARSGAFSFVWDLAGGRGFVLSEAMQGYAPISSSFQPTNTIRADITGTQNFEGHSVQGQSVTVQMNDGTTASFELLRAPELGGVPLRVKGAGNSAAFGLSLSKVRLEQPPAELFATPDGFSQYTSAEVMADELAVRQHNLHRPRTAGGPEVIYQAPTRR
jgi:hypothetical protein